MVYIKYIDFYPNTKIILFSDFQRHTEKMNFLRHVNVEFFLSVRSKEFFELMKNKALRIELKIYCVGTNSRIMNY